MESKESKTVFKLRNNAVRSFGFAQKVCVAGAGCPTPPAAAKQGFEFTPLFALTETEMFQSFRGVLAAMAEHTAQGKPAIEVFVSGVKEPISITDLTNWADEHRKAKKWSAPKTVREHGAEVERAMNRPEDPLEVNMRQASEQRDARLIETVLKAIRADREAAPAKS